MDTASFLTTLGATVGAVGLSIPAFAPGMGEADFEKFAKSMARAVDAGAFEAGALPPCRATIHPQVKILDASKGLVSYRASDESLDSYREAISAKGWRFKRFKINAPFVDSHDYGTIGNQVGKVVSFRVEGRELVEDVQWAIDVASNELAKFGFDMTEKGYLKAVSVGFLPTRFLTRWDGKDSEWQAAISGLNLSRDDAAIVRAIYLEQEQIELSSCIIGANGNAVAKAHKDGALTDEQLDKLATIGERTLSRVVGTQKTGPSPMVPAGDAALSGERVTYTSELSSAVAELRRLVNRQ